jgi:hypothetical protein
MLNSSQSSWSAWCCMVPHRNNRTKQKGLSSTVHCVSVWPAAVDSRVFQRFASILRFLEKCITPQWTRGINDLQQSELHPEGARLKVATICSNSSRSMHGSTVICAHSELWRMNETIWALQCTVSIKRQSNPASQLYTRAHAHVFAGGKEQTRVQCILTLCITLPSNLVSNNVIILMSNVYC